MPSSRSTVFGAPDEEVLRDASAQGCRFYPRCPKRFDRCLTAQPPLYKVGEMNALDHVASCYLYDEQEVVDLST